MPQKKKPEQITVVIPAMLHAIATAGFDKPGSDFAGRLHQAALEAAVNVFIDEMDGDLHDNLMSRICDDDDRLVTILAMMAGDDFDKDDFGLGDVTFEYEGEAPADG